MGDNAGLFLLKQKGVGLILFGPCDRYARSSIESRLRRLSQAEEEGHFQRLSES